MIYDTFYYIDVLINAKNYAEKFWSSRNNTLKDDLGSLKFLHYDYAFTGILTNTGHNEIQRKVIPVHLLPNDRTTFYRYSGSLTTPGCQESVVWYVMTEKLTISESQVKILKNVQTHNGTLASNYRPTQEVGDRKVYHHLLGYSSSPISTPTPFVFLAAAILSSLF
ncbi:hypothetical protein G9C98_006704 [Cotesia typhae]|uniref:Alpha-carbonic anhydrase domain-containing protein n=1 Tax=Cotesia typhae TaxID=2053667 RepID=A0A8J5R0T3_9HYME|nr:hypothetical protein G9C98_006704 [Cotesia typhae]